METIYNYEHAYKFLHAAWKEKKEKHPNFSMRAWAKKLGLQNMAPLSLMLSGKRHIPKKYIPNFIQDLDLTSKEGLYLENLIEFNRATASKEKKFYLNRLEDLHPKREVKFEEIEIHDFFKDPIHFYILDIIELKGSSDDPNWIKRNLKLDYSLKDIKEALLRLEQHKFIMRGSKKYIKLKGEFQNKIDIPSETVKAYHQRCSEKALESLTKQTVKEREFNGFALAFNKKEMAEAKQDIRNFCTNFITKYEKKHRADAIYHINIQFFKVFEDMLTTTKESK